MKIKRSFLIIYLSLLTAAFIFTLSLSAYADTSSTTRLSGFDRYETASQIAKAGWPQSDYAILAYGEDYPDALTAAPLAQKYNAPILLTTSSSLPNSTKQTLVDLQVKNVIIIGGTGVIHSSIDSELQAMGITTSRIAGQDKYETAVKIAQQITTPSAIFVCTGDDYSDALSVAPIAAMKQMPIILVPRDSIPDCVDNYIAEIKVTKTYVVGYSDLIGDSVFERLPYPERIFGFDKYARNIAINKEFDSEFKSENVCVATGEGFADALTGTVYCAKISEPIILIKDNSPTDTINYYHQRLTNASNVYIFGGTGVLSDSLIKGLNSTVPTVSPTEAVNSVTTILTPTQISKLVSPSVLYIETYDSSGKAYGSGSGFVVDSNGKIVTNYHVIEGASSAKVYLANGTEYDVDKVFAFDKDRDIAILGINASGLSPVTLGDSSSVSTGDKIYTIGSPEGFENSLSDGLISSSSRTISHQKFIQITAPISSGSSGGVLLDEKGRVIGITTASIEDSQDLNFAIPINDLKGFLTQDINKNLSNLEEVPTNFADLQNYLNNNFGTLNIEGLKMNIFWVVNEDDLMIKGVDLQIHAFMDSSSYDNWLLLCDNGYQDKLTNNFKSVFDMLQTAFPDKSIWLNGIAAYSTDSDPVGFKPSEVTYDSAKGKWHVFHEFIGFYDKDGKGGAEPEFNAPN
ncbi:cell wall-binding repeat-containing protein [Desulfosporosinus sp. PR]|uniref:cell wall-binding repeat-containing protein n=1 Tax=Candidatus Desulfosporosinus nitrosoreducens TaxID=3401928 RepID=UPI0027FC50F4|nr:cell wall-binding repeat-containing protein [Desulfosporosinus sp. PR]MDQ7095755.1 cell wall-binding repeat-containing protein [Desulfosporosinus sp. PR]